MTIRIAYPSAESRQIHKDGKRVDMNQWDENEKGYGPIKQKFCGENRYIGVKNILEFYITRGCELFVKPRDAIQTMVRMEWTFKEFFANGGTTNFVDRVAGSLGIHASTIKMVSVYEGSVVLNYDITSDDDTSALEAIKTKQTQQFATGSMDLGAPILDVQVQVTSSDESTSSNTGSTRENVISGGVVTASGYDPIIITKTSQNQNGGNTPSSFVPNIPIMQVNSTTVNTQTIRKNKYQDAGGITIIEGSNNTAVMVIIIAGAALLLVALALVGKFIYNRLRERHVQVQYIKDANMQIQSKGKLVPHSEAVK